MIQKKATQKAKKNPPKKPRPQRQRKAFGFDTYQASIRVINFRDKRCLLRISRLEPHDPIGTSATRANAIKSYSLHKIFHTLFPQNSIEPVGIKKVVEGGEAGWGLVSEILKNRSPEYKIYQQAFYMPRSKMKLPEEAIDAAIKKHERFVNETAMPALIKIALETGIHLNNHPVNICNVKGNPVFFEIAFVNTDRLLEHITKKVKNEKTRKKIKKLAKNLPERYSTGQ